MKFATTAIATTAIAVFCLFPSASAMKPVGDSNPAMHDIMSSAVAMKPRELQGDSDPTLYGIDPFLVTAAVVITTSNVAVIQMEVTHADTNNAAVASVTEADNIQYFKKGCTTASEEFEKLEVGDIITIESSTAVKIEHPLNILRDLGDGIASLSSTDPDAQSLTVTIEYCVRFNMRTDQGAVANFHQADITFKGTIDQTGNWAGTLSTDPTEATPNNPIEGEYSVTSFPCDADGSAITVTLTQGDSMDVCLEIADGDFPEAAIYDIQEFKFTSTFSSGAGVLQNAFVAEAAMDLTTESATQPCDGGVKLCRFTTILNNQFYQNEDETALGDGETKEVIGEGIINIRVGDARRRVRARSLMVLSGPLSTEMSFSVTGKAAEDEPEEEKKCPTWLSWLENTWFDWICDLF